MDNESRETERLRQVIEQLTNQLMEGQDREERTLAEFSAMNNELITTQRLLAKRNAELKAAKERAEEADRSKSRFVAMASHELRSPLGGIRGLAELLLLNENDTERNGQLALIRESAEYLLGLIGNLLDLSKLEAEKMEVDAASFNLGVLLEQIQKLLEPEAVKRGNRLVLRIEAGLALERIGDTGKITQVLINLTGNANKFTDGGRIAVSLKEASRKDGRAGVRFEIEDTGIGIKAENRDKLFQAYSQLPSESSPEGTGLGLAISRRLVLLMDGEIGVDSEPGRGSTFWFELPLPPNASPTEQDEDEAAGPVGVYAGPPLLLAEDNPLNAKLMRMQLRELGYPDVATVDSGQAAVEAWQEREFGLVLLDGKLPDMSGAETARRIRTLEAALGRSRVPIVAVTADASKESEARSRAAGMDDWVVKPMKLSVLRRALERWLPAESPPVLNMGTVRGIRELGGAEAAEMLKELLELFRADTPPRLRALERAVGLGDAAACEEIAHSLKSGSLGLGADRLAAFCAEIEMSARSGGLATARRLLPELGAAFEDACAALEAQVRLPGGEAGTPGLDPWRG